MTRQADTGAQLGFPRWGRIFGEVSLVSLKRSQRSAGWLLSACLLTTVGCAGEDPQQKGSGTRLATGSTCPGDPTLTYQGWARSFFESYCTRCHSSTLVTTTERNGATPHANWDDLPTIRSFLAEIDAYAAGGPNGINTVMPPSDPRPTADERVRLGQWLACGAP